MHYNIVLLPGDGIGKEVIESAIRILNIINQQQRTYFHIQAIPCGGEYYLNYQKEWPDGSFEICKTADAILLGAVGFEHNGKSVFTNPGKPYATPQLAGYAPVIANRQKLELYANVRPVKLYPGVQQKICGQLRQAWFAGEVDYVIVKENTEDAYTGEHTQLENEVITPIKISRKATERVVRYACRLVQQRKKLNKITCVDKSNIIVAHRYFRDIFTDIVKNEFPSLQLDYCYADTFAFMQLSRPQDFDVIVAPNLIGDIVSEVGAISQGGLGMAASANIGDNHAMFEPIHGSALAEAGRDTANPLAMLLAVKLMFEWLGGKKQDALLIQYAELLEKSIEKIIQQKIVTADLTMLGQSSYKCSEVIEAVCKNFSEKLRELNLEKLTV
jgi:isocitrate/isopropylmalate dehydrogenase